MSTKTPTPPPKCAECQKTESYLWRNVSGGSGGDSESSGQICHVCFERKCELQEAEAEAKQNDKEKEKLMAQETKGQGNNTEEKRLRKSTRATTRFRSRGGTGGGSAGAPTSYAENGSNGAGGSGGGGGGGGGGTGGNTKTQSKGRSRRNLFKKVPFKTPVVQATTRVVESVFHKGSYIQVGDIVSMVDREQNVYYAQIRGLLVDNYCEKSAYLTWLLPSQASPDPGVRFDPATYLIGPDEEFSRKLCYLEFVMHAPSSYYWDRSTPYPLPDNMEHNRKPGGYIWTSLPKYERNRSSPF